MSVAVFPLGPLETNCYIVSYEGQAVAIDVGGDPAPVDLQADKEDKENQTEVAQKMHDRRVHRKAEITCC